MDDDPVFQTWIVPRCCPSDMLGQTAWTPFGMSSGSNQVYRSCPVLTPDSGRVDETHWDSDFSFIGASQNDHGRRRDGPRVGLGVELALAKQRWA
jgi:hypothetical protein